MKWRAKFFLILKAVEAHRVGTVFMVDLEQTQVGLEGIDIQRKGEP